MNDRFCLSCDIKIILKLHFCHNVLNVVIDVIPEAEMICMPKTRMPKPFLPLFVYLGILYLLSNYHLSMDYTVHVFYYFTTICANEMKSRCDFRAIDIHPIFRLLPE